MNSKCKVECFRFSISILVFFLPENILTRGKCIQIFQKPSERWNKLASENFIVSNALNVAELKLEPFESTDDSFYKSGLFFDDNSRNAVEKMTEIFLKNGQQTEERKAGDEEMSNLNKKKETNNKMYHMNNLNQAPPRNIFLSQEQTFSSVFYLQNEISKLKQQIKKFKKLFWLLSNLQTNLQGSESIESIEKFFPELDGKPEEEFSKATTNNLLQMGGVFFVNGLLVENLRKKTDDQSGMKEILNNLKEDVTLNFIATNPPITFYTTPKSLDSDLIKQLQKNFFKMFHNQDVTLEQLQQMSKIVDFVEKYHGVVGNLKSLDLSTEEFIRKRKEM